MSVVARGVCHNMSADLVIRSDGSLGDNKVAVWILDLLSENSYMANWIFILKAWDITHVFLDGISLHDHNQIECYIEATKDSYCIKRIGMCEYEYNIRPQMPIWTTKIDHMLSI